MAVFAKSIQNRDTERGFTLIELLVVILIIGILAAIAVPMFLNQRKSAADVSLKADIRNAATALQTGITKYPNAKCIRSSLSTSPRRIVISFFEDNSHNGDTFRPTWTCTGGDLMGPSVVSPISEGNWVRAFGLPESDDPDLKLRVEGWNPDGSYRDSTGSRLHFDLSDGGFSEES